MPEEISLTHVQAANADTAHAEPKLDCDVIVAGAGIAGAAAAYYMAKAGLKVTVLEQRHFPSGKQFGYLLSPPVLRELQKIGVTDAPAFQNSNIVDCAATYLSGKELAAGTFPAVEDLPRYARVIPRKALEDLLVEAARSAGAAVLEGYCFVNYAVHKDWVTVVAVEKKEIKTLRTQLLVGADGSNSAVARILKGAPWSKVERAHGVRAYFEGVTGSQREVNLYYGDDSFPGYSWLFPAAKGEANVGVGVVLGCSPEAEDPEVLLKKLLENDPAMQIRLKNARLIGAETCEINLHDQQMPLVGDRVMLIGLAAGLVNPYNGEGIQMGLLSAKWAAEKAVNCMQNHNFSSQILSQYMKRLDYEFGYGFKVSAFMLQMLRNRSLNQAWLQWVELMGQKSRTDPQYHRILAGILSSMIFPNEEASARALTGTLQEAALSVGVTAFSDMMQNPAQTQQSTENLRQTGEVVAQYAAQNPIDALRWGMEAASKMTEIAAAVSKQALKDAQSKAENQQQ